MGVFKDPNIFKQEFKTLSNGEYLQLSEYVHSKKKIQIQHITCGFEYSTTPNCFLKGSRCPNCFGIKTMNLLELKEKILNAVGGEYTLLTNTHAKSKDKITLLHNRCGKEYIVSPSCFLLRGQRCPTCRGLKPKTTSEFSDQVENITNKEYSVCGEYKNNKTRIKFLHNICKTEYSTTPKAFLVQNQRCPKCAKEVLVKHPDKFEKEFYSLVGNEYTLLSSYERSNKKMKIKHNSCGNIYDITANAFFGGDRCLNCTNTRNSSYIKLVKLILNESNIKYKTEYKFKDCKDKTYLYFDIAILDNNITLIEVDGQHHFKPVMFGNMTKEEASYRYTENIKRDNIKNNYCENNNIKLIRIPYWECKSRENIIKILIKNDISIYP